MEKVTDADFVMVALDDKGQAEGPCRRNRLRPSAMRIVITLARARSRRSRCLRRPFAERMDRHQQVAAELGQLIVDARRDRRKDGAGDEAVALQAAQRGGQHLLRDAADRTGAAR